MSINFSFFNSIFSRWNHSRHLFFLNRFDELFCVVGFVCKKLFPFGCFDKFWGFSNVMNISGTEVEMRWISEGVHDCMDFGGRASARASNMLNLGPPFPPVPCWWTRAYVLSTMLDSSSESFENSRNTFFKMPNRFQ